MSLIIDGSKIRNIRKSKDISLKEFSKDIGVSYAYMSHIELGTRSPSLEILTKISHYLKTSIEDLVITSTFKESADAMYSTDKLNLCTSSSAGYCSCMFKNINADFAIKLNDDNLAPFALKGNCVFVKQTKSLKNKDLFLALKDSKLFYGVKITKPTLNIYQLYIPEDPKKIEKLSPNEFMSSDYSLIGKIIFIK